MPVMEKKIDRRILRTQKAIHQAFIELLEQHEMDDISVKMIADQADIGRKTFYLHYVDKYELMDTIVDAYLAELDKRCEKRNEIGLQDSANEWFLFFDEQHVIFERLFRSRGFYSFRNKFLQFTMEQLRKKENVLKTQESYELKIQFLSYGVVGIVEAYVLGEVTKTREELATEISQLVMSNLLG